MRVGSPITPKMFSGAPLILKFGGSSMKVLQLAFAGILLATAFTVAPLAAGPGPVGTKGAQVDQDDVAYRGYYYRHGHPYYVQRQVFYQSVPYQRTYYYNNYPYYDNYYYNDPYYTPYQNGVYFRIRI